MIIRKSEIIMLNIIKKVIYMQVLPMNLLSVLTIGLIIKIKDEMLISINLV